MKAIATIQNLQDATFDVVCSLEYALWRKLACGRVWSLVERTLVPRGGALMEGTCEVLVARLARAKVDEKVDWSRVKLLSISYRGRRRVTLYLALSLLSLW